MTTNPNFKPSEGKREEFRKYLEKNGIMDALTKVLVTLYEEVDKPENALLFVIDKLTTQVGRETHDELQNKVLQAETRIKELEEQIEAALAAEQPPATEEAEGEVAPEEAPVPAEEAPPAEVVDA